jgi:hypothetical protein
VPKAPFGESDQEEPTKARKGLSIEERGVGNAAYRLKFVNGLNSARLTDELKKKNGAV